METRYLDMSQYREGRKQSDVVQLWLKDYKQQIMNSVVYRHGNEESVSEETLDSIHKGSPMTAEIVADTMIGWLNSHVGRTFIKQAFGIEIPTQAPDGSE